METVLSLRAHVSRRPGDTRGAYLKRTVAAQIHLLGAALALVGAGVLLETASRFEPARFAAAAAYALPSILVFGISALYHFLYDGHAMSDALAERFELCDRAAIYLFIAGTYTPFLTNVVAPPWRERLLVLVWSIAVAGIAYTALYARLPRWARGRFLSTGLFVLMGWTMLIRAGEIFSRLDVRGLSLLGAGALCYSLGAIVFVARRPNLFKDVFGYHELWHLSVLGGAAFHYFLILRFYAL